MCIRDRVGIKYLPSTPPSPKQQTGQTLYRVMAGSYAVRENAERQVERLKAAGFDATIIDVYKRQNSKKWIFDIYNRRNFSAGQQINPPVIFSPEFDNIRSQEFIDSLVGFGNYAIVAGRDEGANREIMMLGSDATGLDRHVIFVDARDVKDLSLIHI